MTGVLDAEICCWGITVTDVYEERSVLASSCEVWKLAHANVREIDEVRASILAEIIREDFLEDLLKEATSSRRPHS